MNTPSFFSELQQRLSYTSRERWFRTMVRLKKQTRDRGFFDSYPCFFTTSETASAPDRLNQRHCALIQSNIALISGQKVLDLASHDGRWSVAANKAGAKYVLGIEARRQLVDAARANLRECGVSEGAVEFKQGDMLVELDQLPSGYFDTVFCFGFFYHTIDHMILLRKIARLKPKSLIVDTRISNRRGSLIEVYDEPIEHQSSAAIGDPGNAARAVKGYPSRAAMDLMLKAAGFATLRHYNWQNAGIKRWDDLKAYYLGTRVTVTATAGVQN
jgi:2-polyprenyl-3-methyl-5-hydroxy-6-metoxy-1,4-benzoquinol methylase